MRTSKWVLVAFAITLGPVQAAPPDAERVVAAVVPAGEQKSLQCKTQQAIRSAVNVDDNTVKVMPDKMDGTRVVLTGRKAGVSRLTLTDVQGNKEVVFIVVE
jgi:hypothetical protein